jgi:ATP-dependent Clp protease protease subunit
MTKIRKRNRSDDGDESDEPDDKYKIQLKLKCENSAASVDNSVHSVNNHIYFNSEFNKKSVELLCSKITAINDEFEKMTHNKLVEVIRPKPIYLHITSYGGSLFHCFKAIDAVNRSKIEVHTVVEGYAASCGSLLAVIGRKRYMGRYSSILMHQLSAGAIGKYQELEDSYLNCKMLMDQIKSIYEQHTKMTREEIEEQLTHDSWWNYETCLIKGVVDGEWLEN